MTEKDPSYISSIIESSKYQTNPVGFSNYESPSKTDQVFSRQLNFLVAYIGDLHRKIDKISKRIDSIDKQKSLQDYTPSSTKIEGLEELINKFNKINLDKDKSSIYTPRKPRKPYKYY